jgi:GNAT superfamily N-acetyltransferase
MDFIRGDSSIGRLIGKAYGDVAERHLHFDDGFTLVAVDGDEIAGFASFVWRDLPQPLDSLKECFIDIIETQPEYRRKGIATHLLEMAEELAKRAGAYQLRAWSSCDKAEALSMWPALGYGLAPAVVTPGGHEVHGYFVTKPLRPASALQKAEAA